MTTIYVAMVDDRHRDPEPHLFTTTASAVAYARQRAEGWLVEDDAGDDAGWLYYAAHETESDAVWVVAQELQGDPEAKRDLAAQLLRAANTDEGHSDE